MPEPKFIAVQVMPTEDAELFSGVRVVTDLDEELVLGCSERLYDTLCHLAGRQIHPARDYDRSW